MADSSEEFLERKGVPCVSPGEAHIMLGAGEGHGDGESNPDGQGLGNAVLVQSSSLSQRPRFFTGDAGLIHSSGADLPNVDDLGGGLINRSGRRVFIANGDEAATGATMQEAMIKETCS